MAGGGEGCADDSAGGGQGMPQSAQSYAAGPQLLSADPVTSGPPSPLLFRQPISPLWMTGPARLITVLDQCLPVSGKIFSVFLPHILRTAAGRQMELLRIRIQHIGRTVRILCCSAAGWGLPAFAGRIIDFHAWLDIVDINVV